MLSKACEYGIKAVAYIAMQSLENKRVKLGAVAESAGSPEAFTAKILGMLTKNEIIQSQKGPFGGFEMDVQRMKQIRISDIVTAIDGDAVYTGCVLGLSECSAEQPCPMHDKFTKVRSSLRKMLETTSVFELASQLKEGATVLKR